MELYKNYVPVTPTVLGRTTTIRLTLLTRNAMTRRGALQAQQKVTAQCSDTTLTPNDILAAVDYPINLEFDMVASITGPLGQSAGKKRGEFTQKRALFKSV